MIKSTRDILSANYIPIAVPGTVANWRETYNVWSLYSHKTHSDLSSWNDKVKKQKLIKEFRI